jgi:hypothetical protein
MPLASCGATAFTSSRYGSAKTDKRTGFVDLLEWPDERTKTCAWTAFMKDREWAEIKRATSAQTGVLVSEIEDRVLVPTDHPPALPAKFGDSLG